jgi:cytochrome c peroxidase
LSEQITVVHSSASDLNALLYNLKIDDRQILESIRLELVRIITLGITGFDTPELKTGIAESGYAMQSMKVNLSPFLSSKSKEADSVKKYLDEGIRLLFVHSDFDSFDRMKFLTEAALPLQYHLNLLITEQKLQLNTKGVLNYDAKNLFSADAITLHDRTNNNSELVRLGQKLFFEKVLSGNAGRSCASCHQPEKYFTDELPKSIALDGKSTVQRNAPTLFYCADQYVQFWDGRVKNLEEQINAVLLNPIVMNGDHQLILGRLHREKEYDRLFKNAFPKQHDSAISIRNVLSSISAFLKTLSPFNSPFDRYLQGHRNELTQQQIKGFNLFMGKAQCATCHFVPVFNGLVPPLYKRSELEVLGTTRNIDFTKPELDNDSGRFASFPIQFYKRAFKTPTVRNVAKTAPYMHNGAFNTLHEVLEFYNKGGGAGLGLQVPEQTLSPKPLKLSEREIDNIISFLNSLTDTYDLKN